MKTVFRGTTVDFETGFTNSSGTFLTMDSATITITYPLDGYPLQNGTYSATYSMVEDMDDHLHQIWTYAWDSSDSAPGYVYWHMIGSSLDAGAEDGQLLILSNPAAYFKHGPSTASPNDTSSSSDYV